MFYKILRFAQDDKYAIVIKPISFTLECLKRCPNKKVALVTILALGMSK